MNRATCETEYCYAVAMVPLLTLSLMLLSLSMLLSPSRLGELFVATMLAMALVERPTTNLLVARDPRDDA